MSTNHNRIKVADLETSERDKILSTNSSGELEFRDINSIKTDSYNGLDYTEEGKALDARQGKILKGLIDNIKDTLKTYFDTIYLGISNDQNVLGIKTFLNGTLGIRNAANTFTSFFSNSNTASRTYTLQNRNGTLLDNTDLSTINSSLATKQSVFTGTTNYIPKSLNATTLGSSRLIDNGISFGIGIINNPTKDITLGYQINREIGVEESNNSNEGRDLTITAGRTINYAPAGFVSLNDIGRPYFGVVQTANKDILATSGNSIYKQDPSTGYFNQSISLTGSAKGMFIDDFNNLFVIVGNSLQKQTNSTGPFITETGITPRNYVYIDNTPNGDVYAVMSYSEQGGATNEYIYKRTGNMGDFLPVNSIQGRWNSLACSKINGWIYAGLKGSGLYQSKDNGSTWQLIYTYGNINNVVVLPNGTIYISSFWGGSPNYLYSVNHGVTFIDSGNAMPFNFGVMKSIPNGNVYCFGMSNNQSMALQSNYAIGSPDLNGGTLKLKAGTGKGIGQSRLQFLTGQKTTSGTDMQIETVRAYIDENGYMIWTQMPTYPDNVSAIAGGLPIGCEYKTSTGDRKIVY
ncbi:hypothetical protein NU08_4298 [Flavobacterium anhuiense]|uniref:Uncharacterized protein n=1 Tax=Flavobacterium anhuiense TaxID=459526 RepID=A0A444VT75_9FLAO|nr:sialidase family protein [Flavobacterium anhuiense]RYJ36690.1 hypothetical protein NU08_4298 [Flavobacterium anhuiense]